MSWTPTDIDLLRRQFPALARRLGDRPVAFFDGPAGTQVPQRVIDAVSHYLAHTNANHGGLFATARESDELLDQAHQAFADFVGAGPAGGDCVAFGQNMTSLTFALSRALARTWKPGDEIIVTRLDHDANVTPWVLAARDAGAVVKFVELQPEDCTLNLAHYRTLLSSKTRLVALGAASNATGGVNPVAEMAAAAKQAGALVFVDAVHYAPHRLIDVAAFGCDFLACSAYKFFGPHLGALWGRRELLEGLEAYKVRPAPSTPPGKWMTGTQSHEAIAGGLAAIDYLADLGRSASANDDLSRRAALQAAYQAIATHEERLFTRLLDGLAQIPGIRVWGITDAARMGERVSTLSLTHDRYSSAELAERLGRQGLFAWHGNYYALQLSETLGREPQGMLRIGAVHYNTDDEIERLLRAIEVC